MENIINIKIKIVFTSILLLIISGCATTKKYPLKPIIVGDDLELNYLEGKEVAISTKFESGIAILGTETNKDEIFFNIIFKNYSIDKKINVLPEQIKVMGYNKVGNGGRLYVYKPHEYINKLKKGQSISMALNSVGSALQTIDAGKSTSTTYSTSNSSTGGSISTTTHTTTYDSRAKAEENARHNAQLQYNAQKNAQMNAAVERGLIKANTLYPGDYIAGNIVVKKDKWFTDKYKVTIPIGNDIHIISFVPKP